MKICEKSEEKIAKYFILIFHIGHKEIMKKINIFFIPL